jgi:bis(5'-nucleosyl)-tetraphosphatase (symmetrical)
MKASSKARRLFVGDLHGCLDELTDLLEKFAFVPGRDRLFSVGDVAGKGPDVPGTLQLLKDLDAQVVQGNHDHYLVQAARQEEAGKHAKRHEYLEGLGKHQERWVEYIASWPLYLELPDIIMVHAGLEPGKKQLADMHTRVLLQIRTWDGEGTHLSREEDPPWFECVRPDRIVVFGHWAQRGVVDLPRFKGLDSGCVYGGKLTGWCPEENRFVQVDARKQYSRIRPR